MAAGKGDKADSGSRWTFLILLFAISIAFAAILWPFFAAILWAVIVAILFEPVYRRLLARMPKRRNGAALLTLLLILVVLMPYASLIPMPVIAAISSSDSRWPTHISP